MLPTVDQVTARAQRIQARVSPARAALAVALAPFLLVGLLVGLLWGVVVFCWAACAEGFRAGRRVTDAGAA